MSMANPGFFLCQNENVCSWEGCALPDPPHGWVGSWEGVEARRRRASRPKPCRARAVFTSKTA